MGVGKGNEVVVKCEGVEEEGIGGGLNGEWRILVRDNGKCGKWNKCVVVEEGRVGSV